MRPGMRARKLPWTSPHAIILDGCNTGLDTATDSVPRTLAKKTNSEVIASCGWVQGSVYDNDAECYEYGATPVWQRLGNLLFWLPPASPLPIHGPAYEAGEHNDASADHTWCVFPEDGWPKKYAFNPRVLQD